jgi:hypothetical protein
MSRTSQAKKFTKRAIGDTREKVLWPRLHPETYGVANAVIDRDPSKDPESANILLLRTGYGNQRRLELPGGGAERKRIEIARMVVALAQNRFPHIHHPAPPTDEDYLMHRDSELFTETRIPPDAISWRDGILDV